MSRFVIFTGTLDLGGVERSLVRLANYLSARGHQVHFMITDDSGPLRRDLDPRIAVERIGRRRKPILSVYGLARRLRAIQPSAIFSSDLSSNIAMSLAVRLSGTKARFLPIEESLRSFQLSQANIKGRFKLKSTRVLYQVAHKVVAVSEGVRKDLVENFDFGSDKVVTAYLPLDLKSVEQQAAEAPPLLPVAPYFMFLGRLGVEKNVDHIIRAFARVRAGSAIPVKLLIVGDGACRKALETLVVELNVAADVLFLGALANPFPVLKGAKALVLASSHEGLPTVLVEALACGCEVISSACEAGPAEILRGGRFGALFPVGDLGRLEREMTEVLARRRWQAEDLQRHARETFSVETLMPRFEALALAD